MAVDLEIIANGHLKRELLLEYAGAPGKFDDDTVEQIWRHLDLCEDCMELYEAIREGDTVPKKVPVPPPTPADHREPENNEAIKPMSEMPSPILELETALDAATNGSPEKTEPAGRRAKEPAIEGLISGEVFESEEPMEKIETESLAESEERNSRERIRAALLKPVPLLDEESDPESDSDPADEPGDTPVPGTVVENEAPPEAVPARETDAEQPESRPDPEPPAAPSRPTRQRPSAGSAEEPLERLVRRAGDFVKKPANAVLCAVCLLVVVAAVVLSLVLFGPATKEASPVSGWAPLDVIETRTPLQEVLIRTTSGGRIPAADGTDVTLDFRGIKTLVIAVDLDFIKGKTEPHEVVVHNPEGQVVFQEAVPQIYLDDGRFFLRLIPRVFETDQTYKLELRAGGDAGESLLVAESVFDVLK
jgi:hypothetical protein